MPEPSVPVHQPAPTQLSRRSRRVPLRTIVLLLAVVALVGWPVYRYWTVLGTLSGGALLRRISGGEEQQEEEEQLKDRFLAGAPLLADSDAEKGDQRKPQRGDGLLMVVGMSSLASRSHVVNESIWSLASQSRRPDRIFLHSFYGDGVADGRIVDLSDLSDARAAAAAANTTRATAAVAAQTPPPAIVPFSVSDPHGVVTAHPANSCVDRGPGSKLLCTLEALASEGGGRSEYGEYEYDPSIINRTVIVLADDDHMYWPEALSVLEGHYADAAKVGMEHNTAASFYTWRLRGLDCGNGADLFAIPLSQLRYRPTLAFYDCLVRHEPRVRYHDDAWISLLLRLRNVTVRRVAVSPRRSGFRGNLVYRKVEGGVKGLHNIADPNLSRRSLNDMFGRQWRTWSNACGMNVTVWT